MPIGSLTLAAAVGNRHAQLELGRRFEEGRGVPLDLVRAEELYARAATSTGGYDYWVHVPETEHTFGYSYQVSIPLELGLTEAQVELNRLRAQMPAATPDAEAAATTP